MARKSIALMLLVLLSVNLMAQSAGRDEKADLEAAFLASSFVIRAGDRVNFTDESTGNPSGWLWTFEGGDPATSTEQHPTGIRYYTPGVYTVTLEVQNGTSIDTERTDNCITVNENTDKPIANFKADYVVVPVNIPVTFTNLSQNGPFDAFEWYFEGGIPDSSFSETPQAVIYTEVGSYSVGLKVTDTASQVDSVLKVNYIKVVPAADVAPGADFAADRTYITPGDFINFNDRSNGNPYIRHWYFEGGTPETSTAEHPVAIQYNSPGVYDVTLTVENEKGIDTLVKHDYIVVAVNDPCVSRPVADFVASERLIRSGTRVYFEDLSQNGPTAWNWHFEGGYPTYLPYANAINGIEYNAAGFYDVLLSVQNDCGQSSQLKHDYILVFSGPITEYCDSISNVATFEDGSTETIGTQALTGSWGTIGGHNGQRITAYADKFSQNTFTRIDALLVPVAEAANARDKSFVTFYIWDGNTPFPERVLAEKKILLKDIQSNFLQSVKFDNPVNVDGPFFAGYAINYVDTDGDRQSNDRFSVSTVIGRSSTLNTLYVQTADGWQTCTEKFGIRTSTAIRPVTCITDVEETEIAANIHVFPNPTTDFVNISFGDLDSYKNLSMSLIDITGKTVFTKTSTFSGNTQQIDLQRLPQGLYFLNMFLDGKRFSTKVMVTR